MARTPQLISDVDLAWLAGFMEGEGSFILRKREPVRRNLPRLSAQSTDLDVLERVQRIAGGTIAGPIIRGERKHAYNWTLNRHKEVLVVATLLKPLMGSRRQSQIDVMLEGTESMMIPRCVRGHDFDNPENVKIKRRNGVNGVTEFAICVPCCAERTAEGWAKRVR
jgi:hypothetical protein